MLPKAHLNSHSGMSGSRWVITLSWISGSWRSVLHSSVYLCHLLLISSASLMSIPFLSFTEPIFAWNVSLVSLIFWKRSLVFPIVLFSSIPLHWYLRKAFLSLFAVLWNSAFKWAYLSFSPLLFAFLLFTAICQDLWVTINSTALTMNKTDMVSSLTDMETVYKHKVDSSRDYGLWKCQQTFSINDQTSNILGFGSYGICHSYSTLPLQCESSHRQCISKWVLLYSKQSFIYGGKESTIWTCLQNRNNIHRHRGQTCDCQGGGGEGGMEWEFGINRCKLLYIEWINNKPLLYCTGSCIQSPGINHMENKTQCIHVYSWVTLVYSRNQYNIVNQLFFRGFPGGSAVKTLPANAGDKGSIPGLGRSHTPWSN